jgi:hypothetical protein
MRLKVGLTVTFCIALLVMTTSPAAAKTSGAGYDETQGARDVLGALVAETVLVADAGAPVAAGGAAPWQDAGAGGGGTAAAGGGSSSDSEGAGDEERAASAFHPRVGRQLAARVAPVPIDTRDVGVLALAAGVLALTGAALTGAGVARGRRREERYDAL